MANTINLVSTSRQVPLCDGVTSGSGGVAGGATAARFARPDAGEKSVRQR
jgi:hypothetical protein